MEKHVGLRIKKLRKEHKESLKEMAQKIDYDYSNLSKVERGVYGASVDLLKKITEVYNVSPSYFFSEDFTDTEGHLIIEENLDPSVLKKKYRFTSKDGEVEATDEEIIEALKLIQFLRPKTDD